MLGQQRHSSSLPSTVSARARTADAQHGAPADHKTRDPGRAHIQPRQHAKDRSISGTLQPARFASRNLIEIAESRERLFGADLADPKGTER